MNSIKPIPLVLEDAGGKVIRSFNWTQPKLYLVRRSRTGRLEALAESREIRKKDSEYTLIKSISMSDLTRAKINVPQIGTLRRLKRDEEIQFHSNPLDEETDDGFQKTLRWSAYVHALILILAFSAYWSHKIFFEEEEVVVKLQPPKIKQVVSPRKTVKASNKKINRKRKVVKTAQPKVKPRPQKKRKSVNKMGALAALGGTTSGSKSGRGLKLKSASRNSGSGNSLGTKSLGSATSTLAGKALSAPNGGNGKTRVGGVGYGTKGRSGGQAGYGRLNIGGAGGAGYQYALQEDGSVDGGLEMSQIEAVIKRNLGQIYFCYEKGLQANSSLSGRVAMNFIINGSGRVQLAQVGRSTINSARVENCMVGKIKGWRFPKPHGNVDVNVSYPFTLKRAKNG